MMILQAMRAKENNLLWNHKGVTGSLLGLNQNSFFLSFLWYLWVVSFSRCYTSSASCSKAKWRRSSSRSPSAKRNNSCWASWSVRYGDEAKVSRDGVPRPDWESCLIHMTVPAGKSNYLLRKSFIMVAFYNGSLYCLVALFDQFRGV